QGYDEGAGYALSMLGELEMHQGRYDQATAYFTTAADLRRRLGDIDGQAFCYGRMARILQLQGNLRDAETRLRQEKELLGATPDRARSRAYCHLSLADLYSRLDEPLEVEANLTAAVREFETAADRRGLARTWRELADHYREQDDMTRARAAYKEAADHAEPGDRVESAHLDVLHGKLLKASGLFQAAIAAMEHARASFTTARHHADALWTGYELGKLHYQLDEIDAAWHELHPVFLKFQHDGDSDRAAEAAVWLAKVESRRGDFDRALSHFELAREHFAGIRAWRSEAEVITGLGMTRKRMGMLESALTLFAEAEALFTSHHDWRGMGFAVNNQGVTLNLMGRGREAEQLFRRALTLFTSRGEELGRRYTLRGLGNALLQQDRPAAAIAAFTDALAIRPSSRISSGDAYLWEALGRAHAATGNPPRAARCFRRALQLARQTGDEQGLLGAHMGLARLWRRQDPDAAILHLRAALAVLGDRTQRLVDETSQIFTGRQQIEAGRLLMSLLLARGDFDGALDAWNDNHARAFLDQLEQAAMNPRRRAEPALITREIELTRYISGLHEILRQSPDQLPDLIATITAATPGIPAALLSPERAPDLIEYLEGELLDLRRRMKAADPAFSALAENQPIDWQAFTSTVLQPGEALLGFSLGDPVSTLFIITKTHRSALNLDGAETIAPLVDSFVETLLRPWRDPAARLDPRADFMASADSGRALFDRLIAPAVPLLSGIDTLIIVPDGCLHHLSFAALPSTASPLHFLVEDYAIRYIPSPSALSYLRRQTDDRNGTGALLAVGAIQNLPAGPSAMSVLTVAAAELAAVIAGHGPEPVTVLSGPDASEHAIKTMDLTAFDIIYVGTHAILDARYPLSSAIMLAGGGDDDGRLQAREIVDLNLTARVVVLSACNTAGGVNVAGEGLMSLARTFFYAGARGIVGSLAPVPEHATGELMDHLFDELPGDDPAHALADAQRCLLRSPDSHLSHPIGWALLIYAGG
ncbi:CHAT domain-containing protein, partial [bacterium]|nr:CHAT domain-containing protein [candidate division CSSED10-310 bacterium]